MSDDAAKAEALLEEAKSQSRKDTEPTTETIDDSPGLHEAIVEAYAAIEEGDAHNNLTIRDGDLAALINGLEETGGLEEIVTDAQSELGRDVGDTEPSKALALGLLVRIGLSEVAPDVIETAVEAKKERLESQASVF